MPSLRPLTEGAETLSPLAEGAETLRALAEGTETLAVLVEGVFASEGGTYPVAPVGSPTFPGSVTYPGPSRFPGGWLSGLFPDTTYPSVPLENGFPFLSSSAEGSLDLTPLSEA